MSPGTLRAGARAAAEAVDPEGAPEDLRGSSVSPSVTGDEATLQVRLADRLEALGLAVEIFHPDPAAIREDPALPGQEVPRTALPVVLARAGQGEAAARLILSGHVDVVPPGEATSWMFDPWAGEVRDGRLYGRGACDMKGGIAAILAAVRALAGDTASSGPSRASCSSTLFRPRRTAARGRSRRSAPARPVTPA